VLLTTEYVYPVGQLATHVLLKIKAGGKQDMHCVLVHVAQRVLMHGRQVVPER
jgi:hypothetical protein